MTLPRALFVMEPRFRTALFGPEELDRLTGLTDIDPGLVVRDFADAPGLDTAEILITCWGCPQIDADVLRRAPRLRAVVHTAGTVKQIITDACWERGIAVSSGAAVNGLPVAEYTVAAILFAGKRVLALRDLYRAERRTLDWAARFPSLGNYRKVVGVIGASHIGRRVLELLRPFDLEPLISDPYLDEAGAAALGARLVDLDELMATSDVVSVHAPALPETRHLLDARRLALLADGATLINTARGSLVDMDALAKELLTGRIDAVLDVTEPEVLPANSPLYDLPNVLLTPHIAGSFGGELRRLAHAALDELERYKAGLPFAHAVLPDTIGRSA
ncbi:2-hydroxyacid dehydrogenase [Microtetraspora sp. NBRC 13810]|uniref:hydroxyacid dehydrogenase n=1 Tax=Microtetraspora sp. NBRC 13810 TaxID=3030990 RepID=UPI0024A427C5|nr:hydroxyacid dehydrogenase [Microtetraspora sp. NBRC 13810]GLW05181.1 2-hydroxyacid dehydrogenase [Microtetraspora sp. NBRC 13810]